MSVYGMSRMVATSMGSTTTTAGLRTRLCCSLKKNVYQSPGNPSIPADVRCARCGFLPGPGIPGPGSEEKLELLALGELVLVGMGPADHRDPGALHVVEELGGLQHRL